jgi:hypothetical protein
MPVTRKRRKSRPAGTSHASQPHGAGVAATATPHQVTHSKK